MATFNLGGSALTSSLQNLLMCDNITPGSQPSYEICKEIYVSHPLGAKIAETPITIAQSKLRKISVPDGPEDKLVEAFNREWETFQADKYIFNTAVLARVYGIATCAVLQEDVDVRTPISFNKLPDTDVSINVFDPLNTAGSLTLNQNPNSIDFMKVTVVTVQGEQYHRTRTATILNGPPIYIQWTSSAYGYVGRSAYQRALYPLKSYVQTMVTNDMVSRKAGVLIAKMKPAGSIVDSLMLSLAGIKRNVVKEAETDNVISITPEEGIETLNLQNLDGAFGMARTNILLDIASGADMPGKMLTEETFAEGFGEGTEDAKHIAEYVDRIRDWLKPLYDFFDTLVMYRAWSPAFYETIQALDENYKKIPYDRAFTKWRNSFSVEWPNLLEEPDSKKVEVAEVKLKALIAVVEVLFPQIDQANKATLAMWLADNINSDKLLFTSPLELNYEDIANFQPQQAMPGAGGEEPGENPEAQKAPPPPPPFSSRDGVTHLPRLPKLRRLGDAK